MCVCALLGVRVHKGYGGTNQLFHLIILFSILQFPMGYTCTKLLAPKRARLSRVIVCQAHACDFMNFLAPVEFTWCTLFWGSCGTGKWGTCVSRSSVKRKH